jgi:hypothetical protein
LSFAAQSDFASWDQGTAEGSADHGFHGLGLKPNRSAKTHFHRPRSLHPTDRCRAVLFDGDNLPTWFKVEIRLELVPTYSAELIVDRY